MNTISKINKLKKIEGFIQLNYTKGFKYIDKAGEFFNCFYNEDKFPPPVPFSSKAKESLAV